MKHFTSAWYFQDWICIHFWILLSWPAFSGATCFQMHYFGVQWCHETSKADTVELLLVHCSLSQGMKYQSRHDFCCNTTVEIMNCETEQHLATLICTEYISGDVCQHNQTAMAKLSTRTSKWWYLMTNKHSSGCRNTGNVNTSVPTDSVKFCLFQNSLVSYTFVTTLLSDYSWQCVANFYSSWTNAWPLAFSARHS